MAREKGEGTAPGQKSMPYHILLWLLKSPEETPGRAGGKGGNREKDKDEGGQPTYHFLT